MSATIKFWDISKDYNSTKQPAVLDLICTITGNFRAPVNIMYPKVLIEELDPLNASGFSFQSNPPHYLSISPSGESVVGRYYWIRNWTWASDKLVELELEEDTLATWKSDIGLTTQYVTRSASAYNSYLNDAMYPTEAVPTVTQTDISANIPWYVAADTLDVDDGYYIIGVVNKDDSAYGAVAYYIMPAITFRSLRHALMNDTSWTNMTFSDIEESLFKSLFNPMQYISSARWYPIRPTLQPGDTGSLGMDIGWWPITFGGGRVCWKLKEDFVQTGSFNLAAVNHPQYTRGYYLQAPPYRQRTLYIEPFGSINLDMSLCTSTADYPVVTYTIDWITGAARLRVTSNSTGALLGESTALMGVEVNIAQITQDMMGAWANWTMSGMGLGGAAAGIVTANASAFTSGMSTSINGITNAINSFMPSVQSRGTDGSILAYATPSLDVTICWKQADDDNTRLGKPLCSPRQINTLSGFMMCDRPHVEGDGMTLIEREKIESFMRDGFFYE